MKSDTGELVACHDSLEKAQAQVRALYAAEPEARTAEFRDMEIQGFNFRGVAAVFDSPWNDDLVRAAGYVETLAKGVFRKALSSGANVPLLGAHRRHELLASTQGKTLQLREETNGLDVDANLPQNYLGEYYREMIARDDIRGMSFGFESTPEDSIITRRNGTTHRRIANIQKLLDVTLTWEPAYPATSAELRSEGFAAHPLQALVSGEEEQTDEPAVTEAPSSTATVTVLKRITPYELNAMAEGGWIE